MLYRKQVNSNTDIGSDSAEPTHPPSKPKPCYSHRHMTMPEYGLWNLCRGLSHESKVLTYSIRNLSDLFGKSSPATVHRIICSFVERGWFEIVQDKKYLGESNSSPIHYRVLDHAEWSAKYPDRCEQLARLGEGVSLIDGGVPLIDRCSTNRHPVSLIDTSVSPGVHKADIKQRLYSTSYKSSGEGVPLIDTPRTEDSDNTKGMPSGAGEGDPINSLGRTDPSPELLEMIADKIAIPQRRDGIDETSLKIVNRIPISTLQPLFEWALADSFWSGRIGGRGMMRSFVNNFLQIKKQHDNQRKQTPKSAPLKAKSVEASNTNSDFKYRSKQ